MLSKNDIVISSENVSLQDDTDGDYAVSYFKAKATHVPTKMIGLGTGPTRSRAIEASLKHLEEYVKWHRDVMKGLNRPEPYSKLMHLPAT